MIEYAPAYPLLLGAVLTLLFRGWIRAGIMLAAPLVGLYMLYTLGVGYTVEAGVMGLDLLPVRVDRLSMLFGILFYIAALLGNIYALHHDDGLQHVAAQAYAASAIGAVFAGDLLTLFIYWEVMAVTSSALIFARRNERSAAAGMRYLAIQIASGLLLLVGLIVYADASGSLLFEHIGLDTPGGWLIFIAFGIKCAFPLLHTWLTDAYPEATAGGAVFLVSFTTKAAVYALARGFAGTEILIYIGAVMAFFPIYYAVIENDLRRVLAYSLINQLGFMVVGIGIGTELALNGTVAHAFSHVLYKGVLMMSMGAVLYVTGEIRASELGGLYKRMPKTALLCIIGAASISAFPLFSGFVSKAMVVSAVLHEGHFAVWLVLLFAAAGVFHHAGIKIPFFAFFAHDSKYVHTASEAPRSMLTAMSLGALLCILIGSFPQTLYALLPWPVDYSPYTVSHVLAQLQLLAFSALAFTWLKLSGIYPPELKSTNLDAEWTYRKLFPSVLLILARLVSRAHTIGLQLLDRMSIWGAAVVEFNCGEQGLPARNRTIGGMVLWVALMLATSLVLYYLL